MRGYTKDWNKIANEIKEAAGWKCENCEHPNDPGNGYALTVHHLDANPQNNDPSNLVALCQRCHLKHQHKDLKRQLWFWGPPTFLARRRQAV